MYGKDVERMLGTICQINNEAAKQIHLLAREADHRIIMIKHTHNVQVNNETPDASHGHPTGDHIHNFPLQGNSPTGGVGAVGRISDQLTYPEDYTEDKHGHHLHIDDSTIMEKEEPISASAFTAPIAALGTSFGATDGPKMKEIDSDNYQSVGSFNNSYGSPWTEIYDLQDKIAQMEAYAAEFPTLQWVGEKHSLLALIQLVYTCSVDAKWALLMYHNWIQQAYDHCYNGDDPSVTWEHFKHGKTAGNVSQEFKENAHIKKEDEGWV